MVKVVDIDPRSPHLEEVIKLASANTSNLGFLPKGGFIQRARQRCLLVAFDNDGNFLGYLLYGISQKKMLAYIIHLCVLPEHRKTRVAAHLVQALKDGTKNSFRGIRVHCRRDFEANKIWPNLGFSAVGEIRGRGKKESTLNVWWLDHGHPTLFALIADQTANPKASMDASVIYQLQEHPSSKNEESQSLLADWLRENIELCVTEEIFNEINRHPDKAVRSASRTFARKFPILSGSDDKFQQCRREIRSLFPDPLSESDKSDIRQLARSMAAGADFFVTRDQFLLDNTDEIFKRFGIRIIRPADLIIHQDSLLREAEYQPARLAGSLMKVERVGAMQHPILESVFRAPRGETKHQFSNLLRSCLANPRIAEVSVIRYGEQPVALTALKESAGAEMEVPILRFSSAISPGLGSTLGRHLVQNLIIASVKENRTLTRITDQHLSSCLTDALRENGFFFSRDSWLRINPVGLVTAQELVSELVLWGSQFPTAKEHIDNLRTAISIATSTGNTELLLKAERVLWPVKIRELTLSTFVIPIWPEWAMNLFDPDIGAQDLFGGHLSLIFSVENAYYRASRPRILSAPARILWYVSKRKGNYQGTESIRACSYLDEVVIDKPKRLFAQLRRLGVYEWKDLVKLTKGNTNNEIMAFRFSNTEILPHPISKQTLQEIWTAEMGKNFHIQSPLRIPNDVFSRLYKAACG